MPGNTNSGPLQDLAQQVLDYLPTLTAGLSVLALGVAAGWVARGAIIRILIWLRLDRLGGRFGWRAAFGKGDVRDSLYSLIGSAAMILVLLVFLDNALQILGLTVLSQFIERIVLYLPDLATAALILGVGMLFSGMAAVRTEKALEEEDFDRAVLAGKLVRGLGLFVTGALVLWQLGFARQIVLAAFLIGFGSFGLAFAIGVGIGTARAIQAGWEGLFKKPRKG